MIVRRDNYEGHLFDSGDVHSFMERTGLHPTFPDARQTDEVFLSLRSFCHQRAYSNRNHRAEVTDHRKLIFLWATPMNITVASAHRSEARAKIRARDVEEWFAERGSS